MEEAAEGRIKIREALVMLRKCIRRKDEQKLRDTCEFIRSVYPTGGH